MKKFYTLFIICFFTLFNAAYSQLVSCNAQFSYVVNGTTVQFTPAELGNTSSLHTWYFGDGTMSNLANPSHDFTTCGSYSVYHQFEIRNPNGITTCMDSVFQIINIVCNNPCTAIANFSAQNVNNQSNVYEFINSSVTGANMPVSCFWNFGDGMTTSTQSLSNQTHTYSISGLYNVCLILTSGQLGTTNICRDTFCMSIQAQVNNPAPCTTTASFTSSATSAANTYSFLNTSTGFALGDSIRWTFGDGLVSYDLNPTHTFSTAGTYLVCLRIVHNTIGSTPCVSEVCHNITVPNNVPCSLHAGFSTSYVNNQLNVVECLNSSTSATGVVVYSIWSFGDGTPTISTPGFTNQIHTYSVSGLYTICLKVMTSQVNGGVNCMDSICQNIQVQVPVPNPCNINPSFTYQPAPNQANGFEFTNTTVTNNIPTVTWSFGDSSFATGNVTSHFYNQPGTYNVCMHISTSNTCSADTCITIVVNGNTNPCNLTASFITQNGSNTSTPSAQYFFNTSLGYTAGDSVIWSFGDGTYSFDNNPIHSFAAQGIYDVCLRIVKTPAMPGTPPCASEFCHSINVAPILIAYPNPSTDNVTVNITLNNAGPIYGFIYNNQSMLVAQTIVAGVSGNNTITFNTQNLPPGIYTIRVYYNGTFSVSRFIKS